MASVGETGLVRRVETLLSLRKAFALSRRTGQLKSRIRELEGEQGDFEAEVSAARLELATERAEVKKFREAAETAARILASKRFCSEDWGVSRRALTDECKLGGGDCGERGKARGDPRRAQERARARRLVKRRSRGTERKQKLRRCRLLGALFLIADLARAPAAAVQQQPPPAPLALPDGDCDTADEGGHEGGNKSNEEEEEEEEDEQRVAGVVPPRSDGADDVAAQKRRKKPIKRAAPPSRVREHTTKRRESDRRNRRGGKARKREGDVSGGASGGASGDASGGESRLVEETALLSLRRRASSGFSSFGIPVEILETRFCGSRGLDTRCAQYRFARSHDVLFSLTHMNRNSEQRTRMRYQ